MKNEKNVTVNTTETEEVKAENPEVNEEPQEVTPPAKEEKKEGAEEAPKKKTLREKWQEKKEGVKNTGIKILKGFALGALVIGSGFVGKKIGEHCAANSAQPMDPGTDPEPSAPAEESSAPAE